MWCVMILSNYRGELLACFSAGHDSISPNKNRRRGFSIPTFRGRFQSPHLSSHAQEHSYAVLRCVSFLRRFARRKLWRSTDGAELVRGVPSTVRGPESSSAVQREPWMSEEETEKRRLESFDLEDFLGFLIQIAHGLVNFGVMLGLTVQSISFSGMEGAADDLRYHKRPAGNWLWNASGPCEKPSVSSVASEPVVSGLLRFSVGNTRCHCQ